MPVSLAGCQSEGGGRSSRMTNSSSSCLVFLLTSFSLIMGEAYAGANDGCSRDSVVEMMACVDNTEMANQNLKW
jgi:hypothetical protein